MQLRTFEAATMERAHAEVRAVFGADALILGTEETADGVRVTAAIEPEDDLASLLAVDQGPVDPALTALLAYHALPQGLQAKFITAAGGDPLDVGLTKALGTIRQAPHATKRLLLVGPPGHGKSLQAARLVRGLSARGKAPRLVALSFGEALPDARLAHWLTDTGVEVECATSIARLAELTAAPGPIVVDTPGLSPMGSRGAERLRSVVGAAHDLELAMVLSTEGHAASLLEMAADFMALGCRQLLATKLDLTKRYGGLIALAVSGLELLPASVSDDPRDSLTALAPAGLARLLVHRHRAHLQAQQVHYA